MKEWEASAPFPVQAHLWTGPVAAEPITTEANRRRFERRYPDSEYNPDPKGDEKHLFPFWHTKRFPHPACSTEVFPSFSAGRMLEPAADPTLVPGG